MVLRAGAGRAVKQAAAAGAQFGCHVPVVHQGLAVFNPGADFFNLFEGARMQHQIVPVKLCLDKLCREIGVKFRPIGFAPVVK